MTVFFHEMRQNRVQLLIWSASVGLLIMVCMVMFPAMEDQMQSVSDMFASMGSFTLAFGMDKISMNTPMGFYGIEGANILGIGGGFFAALLGVGILSKEEGSHTAEFLLTHPVSRASVVTSKLMSVAASLLFFNLVSMALSAASFYMIGETLEWGPFLLLQLAEFIMQLEVAAICAAISAFMRRGGLGLGLGLAAILYFINIIANISSEGKALKYITPFSYVEAADILTTASLDAKYLIIGIAVLVVAVVTAYLKYTRKDIAS